MSVNSSAPFTTMDTGVMALQVYNKTATKLQYYGTYIFSQAM